MANESIFMEQKIKKTPQNDVEPERRESRELVRLPFVFVFLFVLGNFDA